MWDKTFWIVGKGNTKELLTWVIMFLKTYFLNIDSFCLGLFLNYYQIQSLMSIMHLDVWKEACFTLQQSKTKYFGLSYGLK